MKIINGLLEEFVDTTIDYNNDSDKQLKDLRLELLIMKIQQIELSMNEMLLTNLDLHKKYIFHRLLSKSKFKAINCLRELQETDTKQKYNRMARKIISNKFFFHSPYTTITRNISGYNNETKLKQTKKEQFFVESEGNYYEN